MFLLFNLFHSAITCWWNIKNFFLHFIIIIICFSADKN